jgi:hypothetical protein
MPMNAISWTIYPSYCVLHPYLVVYFYISVPTHGSISVSPTPESTPFSILTFSYLKYFLSYRDILSNVYFLLDTSCELVIDLTRR